jgi:metal-responsive CopG/Arc/MetJ family transcriptional regulator
MPQVSIYLPDDLYFQVVKHGDRSELIQELLREYFEKEGKAKNK